MEGYTYYVGAANAVTTFSEYISKIDSIVNKGVLTKKALLEGKKVSGYMPIGKNSFLFFAIKKTIP